MASKVESEFKVDLPDDLSVSQDGVMSVAVKNSEGITLTKDYGFTIVEENGQVLAFDLINHPNLGITLLFGNQVFALGFWDDEHLLKGRDMVNAAVSKELSRRLVNA